MNIELRDYFAGLAMQAILNGQFLEKTRKDDQDARDWAICTAYDAYTIASAMMEERRNGPYSYQYFQHLDYSQEDHLEMLKERGITLKELPEATPSKGAGERASVTAGGG